MAKVNHLSSRVLNTSTAQEPECPECIQLPIESLEAVDKLEAFLKDAANAAAKQRMVCSCLSLSTLIGKVVGVGWRWGKDCRTSYYIRALYLVCILRCYVTYF